MLDEIKTTNSEDEFAADGGSNAAQAELDAQAQLAAELDIAKTEATEWREKYLRLLAEFDNFRKRVRSDTELQRNYAAESLLVALLPIMDDLERMLSTNGNSDDPYRRGAELIRDKLRAFLESRGVHRMESLGAPFNPEEHDALLLRPTSDFPAGVVLEVIVPGYRLGDRVIRHAQVVVSELAEAGGNA